MILRLNPLSQQHYSLIVRLALELELVISDLTCYSDSQVALYWIAGEAKDWKPFVQNRVKEIGELVPVRKWKYCRGKENSADIPT